MHGPRVHGVRKQSCEIEQPEHKQKPDCVPARPRSRTGSPTHRHRRCRPTLHCSGGGFAFANCRRCPRESPLSCCMCRAIRLSGATMSHPMKGRSESSSRTKVVGRGEPKFIDVSSHRVSTPRDRGHSSGFSSHFAKSSTPPFPFFFRLSFIWSFGGVDRGEPTPDRV